MGIKGYLGMVSLGGVLLLGVGSHGIFPSSAPASMKHPAESSHLYLSGTVLHLVFMRRGL